jgi:hypothetical protein
MIADHIFTRGMKWIFSTPWAICIFLAFLGTIGVWLVIMGSPLLTWNRLATGTVFGLAVGMAYTVEWKSKQTSTTKRLINGGIGLLTGVAIVLLLGLGKLAVIVAASTGFA